MTYQTKSWVTTDGHAWIEHAPGKPMPCDGDLKVEVLMVRERWEESWCSYPQAAQRFCSGVRPYRDTDAVVRRPA